MKKKRLLITGASGLLGYALCRRARSSYAVYGICHRKDVSVEGVRKVRADLTDPEQRADCFRRVNPHAVIHAAALSRPNDCERDPAASDEINCQASVEIARHCARGGLPFVFTSTDLVFDGTRPPYNEDDPVSPICLYGRHKAVAEKGIRKTWPEATICRMPLMLGFAPGSGSDFLSHMVGALREKRALTLFTDEFRTPVDTESAAEGLLMALERKGVLLHLGGSQRMSRFTMGCLVADILNADHDLLKPLRIEDLPMPAPRSPDVSLSSGRARTMGYAPKDLAGFLERAVPQIH